MTIDTARIMFITIHYIQLLNHIIVSKASYSYNLYFSLYFFPRSPAVIHSQNFHRRISHSMLFSLTTIVTAVVNRKNTLSSKILSTSMKPHRIQFTYTMEKTYLLCFGSASGTRRLYDDIRITRTRKEKKINFLPTIWEAHKALFEIREKLHAPLVSVQMRQKFHQILKQSPAVNKCRVG